AALVLVGLALGSTLYVADDVLQRMPHVQDSVAYLFQAKTFALGRLSVPIPPDPDFFRHEFIVMHQGQWFSKYPPGWPMILALGVLAGAPWVVNPICAALGVLVIYRLGTEVFRPRVGVIAAALAVVSPFFLFLSGSMMSHASGLLFALLFTWAFWHACQSKRPVLPATLTGLAFGAGFLIRPYTMIVIAIPFALYAAAQIGRRPEEALGRYLPAVLAAIPFVGAFLAYNAHFTGNPFYPPQQLWWAFDSVGFGPGHGPWGFTPIDALNNTSRNLLELVEHTYGWPEFLTLSFATIPFLTGRFRTWDWLFLASFAALVGGYGLWWADGIMYGPRFYYEGLGFLVLLTARGIDVLLEIGRRGPRGAGERPRPEDRLLTRGRGAGWIAPLAVCAVTVCLIGFNVAFYFPGQWQLYHGYNYVNHSKLDAVAKAGIHHALVFADVGQSFEWWEYGMVFSANDPLLEGDVIYARDLGAANDLKVTRDFPGRTSYRLDGTALTPLR
ncbi:MAG: glycosyltransferase family 39 protein, partial [Chloroflexota bacterium]